MVYTTLSVAYFACSHCELGLPSQCTHKAILWVTEESEFDCRKIPSTGCIPVLGPVQLLQKLFSSGMKRPVLEGDHSPQLCAVADTACYRCLTKHRENFVSFPLVLSERPVRPTAVKRQGGQRSDERAVASVGSISDLILSIWRGR